MCQKGFTVKSSAQRHVKEVHHIIQQDIQCPVCLKWFKKERSMKEHFRLNHKQ